MKPEAPATTSDALTDTGGSLIAVVMVAVESMNMGVDKGMVVCAYETPTGGHGVMVMGVVIVL